MKKTKVITRPSPYPVLIAALAWCVGCLFLPMIRLWHYLVCALLAVVAGVLAKKKLPDVQETVEIELSVRQQQQQQQLDNGYQALEDLTDASRRIDDPPLRKDLERIEQVCRQILQQMEQDPDCSEKARRLVDYYLPMLTRLIRSYDHLEEDPLQTETILQSRDKIRKTTALCAQAFVRQWDALHEHQAMEIQADSDVLETLLASDGLTEKEGD